MQKRIIILGDTTDEDLSMLCNAVAGHEFEICCENTNAIYSEEELPAAFISFLACTPELIIDLFGRQPVGFGEKIPYFQRIETADVPSFLMDLPHWGIFKSPLNRATARSLVMTIEQGSRIIAQNRGLITELIKYRKQKHQLVRVGTTLSNELSLARVLQIVLSVSRDITCADAGSIYVRDRKSPGGSFADVLRFKVTQNDSIEVGKTGEFTVPINENTISGYVAATGRPLSIDDVYLLDEAAVPYRFGRNFERRFGYRVKSMLTMPLKNLDGEVVGVLQLMNKKADRDAILVSSDMVETIVQSFTLSDEDLVASIAAHAAVSIERVQLYENIRGLFEGFLNSSIAAIDERDRVTSGHSKRVMGYAMAFVEAAALDPSCPFAELAANEDRKRQFQFAALLHDIGKIGVPERVLTKNTRLTRGGFAALMARMDYIELALEHAPDLVSWQSAAVLKDDRAFLERINIAGFLNDADYERLSALKKMWYCRPDSPKSDFLSESEWEALSVRAGNLTKEEREMINSHAVSTYRILSKIPWTRQLEMIPDIASHHHERIDGSGYPDGLAGEEICVESRILALIDIYEALVAQDRPYKPKMPPEKALEILAQEVERGHLDPEVLRFFVDKNVYRLYM